MNRIIKICGLREPEDALAAAEAGATHIGYNFAPSRRRVDAIQARRCIEVIKASFPDVVAVGLFVDAETEEILTVSNQAGVDVVQLHNQPNAALIAGLALPVLPVTRTVPGERVQTVVDYYDSVRSDQVGAILLDAYHPTLAGGTGALADWDFAAAVAVSLPVVLAGGLNPTNVGDAIRKVRPLGIDVSSGVERDGRKDTALIRAFIEQAQAAFAELDYSTKIGASSQESP
jgi:phosphoribosylanthranilate isomerase